MTLDDILCLGSILHRLSVWKFRGSNQVLKIFCFHGLNLLKIIWSIQQPSGNLASKIYINYQILIFFKFYLTQKSSDTFLLLKSCNFVKQLILKVQINNIYYLIQNIFGITLVLVVDLDCLDKAKSAAVFNFRRPKAAAVVAKLVVTAIVTET